MDSITEPIQSYKEQINSAIPYLIEFCKMYDVKLTSILPSNESQTLEPMYFFTSDLGGFTLEGVVSSLDNYVSMNKDNIQ